MANYKTRKGSPVNVTKKLSLNKSTSETIPVSRLKLGEVGWAGLKTVFSTRGTYVDDEQIYDLKYPQSLDTFMMMTYDATVSTALEVKQILVLKALGKYVIEAGDEEDNQSVEAAKYIDWCLQNLQEQTFEDVLKNILTYNRDGFSILEKVYQQINSGEYTGKIKLKRLSPRSQRSLDTRTPWVFSEDGREVIAINQSTRNLPATSPLKNGSDKIVIPRNKLMLFSWNGTNIDPQGKSPLRNCYSAWKEKRLIEELQVIGASKDLTGTPVLRIPTDILNKAAEDTSSPEYQAVQKLQQDAANMHAGEQAYVILPSDRDERGNYLFDIKLIGVDGSNKNLDLTDAINKRKKDILDSFGAGFMSLGNEGGGSHALMDGKTTVHEAFVQRDIDFIISVFEKELFPQLLALNGYRLTQDKMPKMKAGHISEESLDDAGKMLQRVLSVKAIPKTPEIVQQIINRLGFTYQLPEGITQEQLDELFGDDEMQSRGGDGMSTAGDGTSTSPIGASDASVSNNENGGAD